MTAVLTDVNYRMSLALIRSLGEAGVSVVACQRQNGTVPIGFASKYCARQQLLPDDGYLDALYEVCAGIAAAEGERPALLPVGAATLKLLAQPETRARFQAVCGLFLPAPEQLELLNDKERAAALAVSCGVPVPRAWQPEPEESEPDFLARVPLPCVVKPHCGEALGLTAADRYIIARDRTTLEQAFALFRDRAGEAPLVQEYLPGGALGCSVLAEDGVVLRHICHRRVREYPITGGPSSCCDAIRCPELEDYVNRMAAACGYSGLAMFEFKEDAQGHPRLLEVNPRIWGTYPLTRVAGTNFSLLWFLLSYNAGNPDNPYPLPPEPEYALRRMTFFPTDQRAARAYRRAGQGHRAKGAFHDLLTAKDGLFEWGDPRPAFRYWRSLLQRGRSG